MKIRKGFVSNSSSSSFVIALTRGMEITAKEREEIVSYFYENYFDYFAPQDVEEYSEAELSTMIDDAIEALCSTGQIYKDGCYGDYSDAPLMVPSVVHSLGDKISVTSVDVGPDAESYVNVLADKEKEEFINKITKILEQENNEN